jgi:hypothetical protein
MKKIFLSIFAAVSVFGTVTAQNKIVIPDTRDYLVLTGDMHMHTIFSDGSVWPTTRIKECVAEGVEVLCMTDHMDGRHQKMVRQGVLNGDRNTSNNLAAKAAEGSGVILIRGGEISRNMAPGHFNTLFVTDLEPIAQASDAQKDHQKGMLAGLEQAQKQNAFCVWNHPHWAAHQHITKWHDEHTEIYEKGYMHGIEVYNMSDGFSNEAFQWAIDKNLTLISGTDCHGPMFEMVRFNEGELRPVTLIFAKEATEEGVKEALQARRTAIFAEGKVYGNEQLLTALVDACLKVTSVEQVGHTTRVTLENNSSIPFHLKRIWEGANAAYSNFNILYPFGSETYGCTSINVYKTPVETDVFELAFQIENFFVAPGKHLTYRILIKKP